MHLPFQTDKYHVTNYGIGKIVGHFPVFFYGVIYADLETFHVRPLDTLRELHWGWKIPINFGLFFVAVSYGSYSNNRLCDEHFNDGYCVFWEIISWDGYIPMEICTHIGANALIILALTSDWMAIFLGSVVIQFMGKISFSLYLVHELFTEWAIVDTYYFFIGKGVE